METNAIPGLLVLSQWDHMLHGVLIIVLCWFCSLCSWSLRLLIFEFLTSALIFITSVEFWYMCTDGVGSHFNLNLFFIPSVSCPILWSCLSPFVFSCFLSFGCFQFYFVSCLRFASCLYSPSLDCFHLFPFSYQLLVYK